MHGEHSDPVVSGPVHVIRLRDRRVNVQLQYNSPPKKQRKDIVREIDLHIAQLPKAQEIRIRKVKYLNSQRSLKKYPVRRHSPFFYANKIEESSSLLVEFERFHKRMENNESEPCKIKVYSNSKELKAAREVRSKDLVAKDINIKAGNARGKVPIRRIKLYSPKKQSKDKENMQNSLATIKLQQPGQPNTSLKASPCRKYKLQVTSSKSRQKYDSMLSNKQQRSIQISKQKHQQQTPGRHLKSFNSSSLNDR